MHETAIIVPTDKVNQRMLTVDIVHAAYSSKRIAKRAHARLIKALELGVTDPVASRLSKGSVRLWFELVDEAKGSHPVNDSVIGAQKLLETKLSHGCAPVHRAIISIIHTLRHNDQFGEYISPWLAVTDEHVDVLEAVAWIWLYATGYAPDEPPIMDNHGNILTLAMARRDPASLIRVLSQFKRQYDIRGTKPSRLVDTLALKHGWWRTGDEIRSDVLLYATVCDALSEHEWVPREEVEAHAQTLSADDGAIERLTKMNHLVSMGECITLHIVYETSARVKTIVRSLNETFPLAHDTWPVPDNAIASLTCEQLDIVRRVADGNRLTLVCAPAGTGKTHTAMTLASVAPHAAKILCLAPTHKALSVLRKKFDALSCAGVCIEFMTVHRFTLVSDDIYADLVIVDETSMITMAKIRSILECFYRIPNTRVLLMGDDAQLPCIGRGSPIRDLQDSVVTIRLSRCMRTDGQSLINLATAIRTGAEIDVDAPSTDQLRITDVTNSIADTVVGEYPCDMVYPPWDTRYVQIITPQNKHVKELNVQIQNRIARDVSKPTVSVSGCFVGDAVRIVRNTPVYKNGDEGILEDIVAAGADDIAIHGKGKRSSSGDLVGIVRLQNGTRVRVWKYDMDPAYATTVHKVQGSEYPHVVLAMFPNIHPNLRTREILYTSVTRARDRLHITGNSSVLRRMVTNPRRTVYSEVGDADSTPLAWNLPGDEDE